MPGARCIGAWGLIAGLLIGCADPPISRYTLVTTDSASLRVEILKEDVSGWSCKISTVLDALAQFPWRAAGKGIPSSAHAVEMALRSVPGSDLLIDTSATKYSRFYLLWSKQCVTITGKAARLLL